MKERDVFKLFRLGVWTSYPAGMILLIQGKLVDALSLIVDGGVSAELDGTPVDTLREGRFLGSTAFLSWATHFIAPVTVRATELTRVVVWKFAELETQLAKDIDLEVAIESSLGLEISYFLQTARVQIQKFNYT